MFVDERNVTIVFAPNILRNREETTSSFVADMKSQHRIIKTMIAEYDASPDSDAMYAKMRAPKAKSQAAPAQITSQNTDYVK